MSKQRSHAVFRVQRILQHFLQKRHIAQIKTPVFSHIVLFYSFLYNMSCKFSKNGVF